MKKKFFLPIFLLVIFTLALLLRLYKIDALPIYADETGQYLYSLFFSTFHSFSIPIIWESLVKYTFSFTWLFGLSALGVRFGSALYGSISAVIIFFLARKLSKNIFVAICSSILMVVMPWEFMISRIGHTHIPIIVMLTMLHLFFIIRSDRRLDQLLSALFLALSVLYYPSMVVVFPFAFALISWRVYQTTSKSNRKYFLLTLILLGAIGFIGLLQRFAIFSLQGRALDLAIWRDVNTVYDTDKYRALSWNSLPSVFSLGLPPEQLANKLFFNRLTANVSIFAKNYFSFFSPDWLFFKGDAILRHSTGLVGAFYPFLIPFMLYGAFMFFQSKDRKVKTIFLVWILVSPIPAAITKDGAGYLLRVVTTLPFLTYFCALGLVESFSLITKRLRPFYFLTLLAVAFYSIWYFFYGYFHVYPSLAARSFEYGFKELSNFQAAHLNAPMLVIWDGYYHDSDFRFWQKTPLDQYQAFKMKRLEVGGSVFWQTFPNLYFSAVKSTPDLAQFIKDYHPAYIVLPDRYFYKYPDDILKLLSPSPVLVIYYPDKTGALTVYTPDTKRLIK